MAPLAAPLKERRNSRFTATLMLQFFALARDFARAYRSLSRLTVSLMTSIVVQWCSGVNRSGVRAYSRVGVLIGVPDKLLLRLRRWYWTGGLRQNAVTMRRGSLY